MTTRKPKHEFPRGEWNPVKRPGVLTARAKRAGISVHQEAEKNAHSSNPRIKKEGVFALNVEKGKFHPRTGPKKATRRRSRSRS